MSLPCQIRKEKNGSHFLLAPRSFTLMSLYFELAIVSVVLGGRNWLWPESLGPQIILVHHYLQVSWFSFKLVPALFLPILPFWVSFLLLFIKAYAWVCTQSLSCVWLFVTLWTEVHQAPLSMGFSRQEHWRGLPCSPPGDLPDPGVKPGSPALQVTSLPSEPGGKPCE